jgi:predicted MFS family arabinose efflux permease
VNSYSSLVCVRVFLAAAEAMFATSAFALLESLKFYPSSRSALVIGLFTGGVYLGESLASGSVLLSSYWNFFTWRTLFVFFGATTMALSFLNAFLIRKVDIRDSSEEEILILKNADKGDSPGEISFLKNPAYWLNLVGSSIRNIGGYGKLSARTFILNLTHA